MRYVFFCLLLARHILNSTWQLEWHPPVRDQPRYQRGTNGARQARQPLPERVRSPSPSSITSSDEEIPLQQSGRCTSPAIVRSEARPPQRKLEESHESEESMILGLDFV